MYALHKRHAAATSPAMRPAPTEFYMLRLSLLPVVIRAAWALASVKLSAANVRGTVMVTSKTCWTWKGLQALASWALLSLALQSWVWLSSRRGCVVLWQRHCCSLSWPFIGTQCLGGFVDYLLLYIKIQGCYFGALEHSSFDILLGQYSD